MDKEKKDSGYLEEFELLYMVVANPYSQRMVFVDTSIHAVALESLLKSCADSIALNGVE